VLLWSNPGQARAARCECLLLSLLPPAPPRKINRSGAVLMVDCETQIVRTEEGAGEVWGVFAVSQRTCQPDVTGHFNGWTHATSSLKPQPTISSEPHAPRATTDRVRVSVL
jgi:hypothetical protein